MSAFSRIALIGFGAADQARSARSLERALSPDLAAMLDAIIKDPDAR